MATLAAELGDLGFLRGLQPVTAAEASLSPDVVRFSPEIEPLVRLLEDTPRAALLEQVADRIRGGVSYREVLAALLLAGVRNVEPRPEVGFKFHAVLVVNSAHLASLNSPDEHRWLPIFWALDHFKDSQSDQIKKGPWRMRPVDEAKLPTSVAARDGFASAMDKWDESAADAAVAAFTRTAGQQQVFETFFRYAARDFRSIGHKAIYVANSRRTLECIGWQHGEPVLRSLAYTLLMHEGDNPSTRDAPADRSWRQNVELAAKLPATWLSGTANDGATRDMLAVLRSGTPEEASQKVVELIGQGHGPQAVWDALFVGAGELLARQPGIVALHAVTTTNALAYLWQTSGDDHTRRMLLLQNAAFVTLFRQAMEGRGTLKDVKLESLEPEQLGKSNDESVGEIFAAIQGDRMAAARKVLAYVNEHPHPGKFIDAARLLIFLKGNNAHDYKFSSAVLEDYRRVSDPWRGRFLASSVFNLRGSHDRDNDLVQRTRAALEV